MDNLPDNPVLRKRAKLRKRYPGSRAEAQIAGAALYFPDAHCPKCNTWAVCHTDSGACGGCDGSAEYAGKRIRPKKPRAGYKRKNPTTTSPAGKLILTPAKYWHRDYRK